MNNRDRQIVYEAIRKYGDDFWNDTETPDGWNAFLFDEILAMLRKAGFTLELKEVRR